MDSTGSEAVKQGTAPKKGRRKRTDFAPRKRSETVTDAKRREAFVQAMLSGENVTQTEAAVRAGYAPRSAHTTATRLMKDPLVQERIREAQARRAAACDMSADEITRFLVSMARGEVLATIGIAEGCAIEAPPKHADRIKAADMLLKLTGAYPDQKHKVEVSAVPATSEQLEAALEQRRLVEAMQRKLLKA